MKKRVSVFVGADIHEVEGKSRLEEVLGLVKPMNPAIVLLGGDHVGLSGPPKDMPDEERARLWTPEFSLEKLRERISRALGGGVDSYFTYGSHDKKATEGEAGFLAGAVSTDYCHLYGISFSEMRFADERQRSLDTRYDGIDSGTAENGTKRFLEWAAKLGDHKPILVMSHMPLHKHRGDNLGASIWCGALNRVAEKHDVFVFFAHNHTAEKRSKLDRQYYLIPAGNAMEVQGRERGEGRRVTIHFTYLNAGYILKGCGTILTFSDGDGDGAYDTVTVRRCAQEEADTAFGDTGIVSPYTVKL